MSWSRWLTTGCVLLVPTVSAAQGGREVQFHGTGVFAGTTFIGGGIGAALRSAGHGRAGMAVSAGSLDGAFAGRGELVLSYHLAPYRRRGVSPYAGGGVAVMVTKGDTAEYLVLLVGLESAPGRRTGWFAEVGVAGGVRAVAGMRVRWRTVNPR